MATAADLIADAIVWAAAHDNTWADPDSAAGTTTALIDSGVSGAQLEMAANDPLRDNDLAAQQLHDLEMITPETVYFGAAPDFAGRPAEVAAEVKKFENQYPGATVTFSVDEGEGEQGVLVEVSIGNDVAVFVDDEYSGWQDVAHDMVDAGERIEALTSDPVPDLGSALSDVSRTAKYVHYNWGYVGVYALRDALSATAETALNNSSKQVPSE